MPRLASILLTASALLAMALALLPERVRALCAAPQEHLELLLGPSGPRPRSGGFLVVREQGPRGPRVLTDLSQLRLVGPGQRPIQLDGDEVASGAWALRPVALPGVGRHELRGLVGDALALELVDTPVTAPARPRVRRLRTEVQRMGGGPGPESSGFESRTLRLELTAPAPARGVAVLEWTENGEVVTTWGRISSDSRRPSAPVASAGRCSGHGRFPPRGARVTVRVIDTLGQISPPTRPMRAP